MSDEELSLVAAARKGDVASFNQLVEFYQGRVYNVCYRMLGDAESAADVTQDTFLSAYRKLRSFRGGSFRSWLLRIATNACYDVLRSRKRRPTTSLDALVHPDPDEQAPFFEPADQGESPDEAVLRHELGAALVEALAQLPDDQRLAIILCDVQGMQYQEVAEITASNLGTVKSRLSRGRARLRDILKAGELLPGRYRHEGE